jgi:hypothetical protein
MPRSLIGGKPSNGLAAERWVRRGSDGQPTDETAHHEVFPARLTIDVTKELRGRIKIAAFQRGSTVAKLLRQVLQREFGEASDKT